MSVLGVLLVGGIGAAVAVPMIVSQDRAAASSTTQTTMTTTTATTVTTTSQTTTTATTATTSTSTTSTSTTSTSTTSSSSTTSQTTITCEFLKTGEKTNIKIYDFVFVVTPVGIYALSISKCATWNANGTTIAGNQNGSAGSDLISLRVPVSIFVDNNDTLTVTDRDNYRIQKFENGSRFGITLASNTSYNPLGQMRDLHIDVNNNIYITDSDNNVVGKYVPYSSQGIVLAGGGSAGSGLDQLNGPFGNFMDANNSLYVADASNHRVLKYEPGSLNGTIVAGNGSAGSALNQLNTPFAIIVDNNGYDIRTFVSLMKSNITSVFRVL